MSYKFLLFLFFSCGNASIKVYNNDISDNKLDESKWYFYAFCENQVYYCADGKEQKVINTSIDLLRIDTLDGKTYKYFFKPYYEKNDNWCDSKSFEIVGVQVTHDKYYTPIIHNMDFDNLKNIDSIKVYMEVAERKLLIAIKNNAEKTNNWLEQYYKNIKHN